MCMTCCHCRTSFACLGNFDGPSLTIDKVFDDGPCNIRYTEIEMFEIAESSFLTTVPSGIVGLLESLSPETGR